MNCHWPRKAKLASLPARFSWLFKLPGGDQGWAFRYGSNEKRPIPAAKGGPWRAQDWQPWSKLKGEQHGVLTPIELA